MIGTVAAGGLLLVVLVPLLENLLHLTIKAFLFELFDLLDKASIWITN